MYDIGVDGLYTSFYGAIQGYDQGYDIGVQYCTPTANSGSGSGFLTRCESHYITGRPQDRHSVKTSRVNCWHP